MATDLAHTPEGVIGHLSGPGASLLRRFLPFLTSKHDIEVGGEVVATVRQKFRFFIKEFHVDQTKVIFGDDLDSRLIMTCALLATLSESQRARGEVTHVTWASQRALPKLARALSRSAPLPHRSGHC